ncbi:hypothetical protein HanOQP8_Chr05g0190631 [Helianthus annuus]|nr:hypothetical protein HanOQP8_Chr05g0190631 [Helianthus annuus]KAJ0750645.1 hypothetical protein HanLR1_Chr05g0184361 [Helianthus annuus]KAJ0923187.1 hypothetical protein HanPSC8_Chr05g0212821 [Helianthus annuus]
MDFNPKHDSVHIPPDPPPDLGFGSFVNVTSGADTTGVNEFRFGGSKEMNSSSLLKTKDTTMGSKVCVSAMEVPTAAESSIIRSVVLAESDVVCLGRVLGDNWRSRVLKEKIVFSNSDLRVSFSADTDLEGINAGCSVNLLIEGLGKRSCPVELFSGQYGSVLEVLSNLAKCSGISEGGNDIGMKEMSGIFKLPQMDPNINVFDIKSSRDIECLDKRKKRSIRNEGLQVKASKVMWDNRSYIKVPSGGKNACMDEILPDGACSFEMVDSLAKSGCKGRFRDGSVKGNRRGGFNDNAMFSFSVTALNLSFKPGSKVGKIEGVSPVFM